LKIVILNPEKSQEKYKKTYLDKKHGVLFKILDINGIDKICDRTFIYLSSLKSKQLFVCKMKDNSYCLCEDFLKDNNTEIKFIFKNRRKRWMIKNGYIKRDRQIRREDREVNNKFRQQYKVK
jgi:hypothetical protein